jgi:glycosyltransferase involved in cell wall biosynthesis
MLFAFWYAMIKKKKHVMFTDSWLHSVNQLTIIHKIVRRIIIKKSQALICIGNRGMEYLKKYAADENRIFISRLVIDNEYYSRFVNNAPFYDVMFSGQFIERKLPMFFCDVIEKLYAKKKDLKVLIIGNGPLRESILVRLNNLGVHFCYPGFIQQDVLPSYYANAKILLFPTLEDHWGIVSNEALAAGIPVITTNNAGVAYDLVLPGITGWVIDLEPGLWAEKCLELFDNPQLLNELKANCISHIQNYSLKSSAEGFIKAILYTATL